MPHQRRKSERGGLLVVSMLICVLFVCTIILVLLSSHFLGNVSYVALVETAKDVAVKPYARIATHRDTPSAVKGIYMTSCVASRKDLRTNIMKLIDTTELNSVVIDVKTYDGYISFPAKKEELQPAVGGGCFVSDMQDFVDELHAKGIYVIGRIATFQDNFMVKHRPELAVKMFTDKTAVWKDRKGVSWIDAGAKEHWDYIALLAKDAYSIGFDEINFDYIRFPSDGDMKNIYFPFSEGRKKADVVEAFFAYLAQSLRDIPVKRSADLFGMVTTNTDDLNIGQVLEKALPYFDYIAPMVYPSHYPYNFNNWGDPNKHPYDIIKYSMDRAVERTIATTTVVEVIGSRLIATTTPYLYSKPVYDKNKLRPWLQDNNYPVTYTPEMVRAQMTATYDTGLNSWLLWNAANKYSKDALLVE
jgi:hypothetical protein